MKNNDLSTYNQAFFWYIVAALIFSLGMYQKYTTTKECDNIEHKWSQPLEKQVRC